MLEAIKFVEKMKNEISDNVQKPLECLNDRNKQMVLCEFVRYIDYIFEEDTTFRHAVSCKTANLIEYVGPFLLQFTALKNSDINGALLTASSKLMKEEIQKISNNLEIYGRLETCEHYIKTGLLKLKSVEANKMELIFSDTYNNLERIDSINNAAYSNSILYTLLPHNIKRMEQNIIKPILDKMDGMIFSWNEQFIGYEADEEVDDYYIHNAVVDLIQDTEWDAFEQRDKFGGIEYDVFIGAILMLETIAMKHLQFVYLALEKYSNIDKYNILSVFDKKNTICESLQYFLNIDEKIAQIVLRAISLNQNEISLLNNSYLSIPPYIEIAKDYYIRSYAGALYEPVSFLLFKLKKMFPKDWNHNIQKREERFRNNIYDLFPDEFFIKFKRNIVLKRDGRIVTDIDACLYDKKTGYIFFIQLKWQDSIYDSFNSMVSKRKNYIDKVNCWIQSMQEWIQNSSLETIASHLQVHPKMIDKEKIKLLVVGRFNCKYSHSENDFKDAIYCQWFQLKMILLNDRERLFRGDYNIDELFCNINNKMTAGERKDNEKHQIYYNGKRIIYNGLFYNEA